MNATKFPDDAFRTHLQNNYDKDGDAILSDEEIASITELSVSNMGITSLDGTKYLTSLTKLDCSNNPLTTLLALGNQSNLKEVNASNCTSLTTLSFQSGFVSQAYFSYLNLSNCTSLTSLTCTGTNSLVALDVSGCIRLTDLKCTSQNISTLNITGCSSLKVLRLYNNKLTNLNVSGFTNLTTLDCSSNPIASLNASLCTSLTDLTLPTNTSLKSLNISGCTSLTGLSYTGYSLTSLNARGCTKLTTLNCYNNKLTSLNVTGCTALTGLYCYGNFLPALDVSSCASLKTLYCYNNSLTRLDVSRLAKLTSLSCYDNLLKSLNVSGCTALTNLQCNGNALTVLDVSDCVNLSTLYCQGNRLTSLNVRKVPTNSASNTYTITLNADRTFDLKSLPGSFNPSLAYGWLGATQEGSVITVEEGVDFVQYYYAITNDTSLRGNNNLFTLVIGGVADPEVKILTQPADVTVSPDEAVSFSVKASGSNLKYQWQYRRSSDGAWTDSPAESATTDTLTLTGTLSRNGYQYRCVVTGDSGSVTSNVATLTVRVVVPTITSHPASVKANVGETVSFTVQAEGEDLAYQWQYRKSSSGTWANSPAASATTDTLTLEATASRNGYQYRCIITNAAGGSATSNAAALTVVDPNAKPKITKQPVNRTLALGKTATFAVRATGQGLKYQWQVKVPGGKWKNVSGTGCRTNTFKVKVTKGRNGYYYRCKITAANGKTVYSKIVRLKVK